MSPGLLSFFTFLAVLLGVIGVYSLLADLFFRDRERLKQRISEQFQSLQHERARKSLLVKDFIGAADGDPTDGAVPVKLSLHAHLQIMLDQSGLSISIEQLLASCSGAAALVGLVGGALQRSLVVGLIGAVVGAPLPIIYVRIKRNARMEALRLQLSDAFELMARILRAGQSMAQAMQGVATEFPSPIAEEFAFSSEQQNLGLSPEISLRGLARRTGLIELNIFVVAVLVQRQVGGNLSEILENLAKVVRERYRIRGVIRGLTAEGRLQALVLMALPPLLFLLMLVVNHDYAASLLDMPLLLAAMVFFQGMGALWIRKIVNFDF